MLPTPAPLPVVALLRLLALTQQFAVPNEMNDLLRLIIDAGRDLLGARRGAVLLYDATRRELLPAATRGCVVHYLEAGGLSPRRRHDVRGVSTQLGLAGACAEARRTINVADVALDSRYHPGVDHPTGTSSRSIVSVPLMIQNDELVGVLQLTDPVHGAFDSMDEDIAAVLAGHAAAAIQQERRGIEHLLRLKMERDLEAARSIQEGVLPATLPTPDGYVIAAFSRPAEQTGGDIYDVICMGPTGASPIALLLADASGHGIAPALSVVQVRAMLRVGLRLGASLVDLVHQIDAQLVEDLADDQFVTAFVGCLDPVGHSLVYHSAGQGPLLHYHAADGRAEWRGASALPLGVLVVASQHPPPHMAIEPGDVVALLTDGFFECTDPSGGLFGEDRVTEVISRHLHLGATATLDALVREVDAFTGGAVQADDLTAIVLQRPDVELAA